MKLANLFSKRNREAASKPANIWDFYSSTDFVSGKEATAFSAIDLIANAFASLSYGVYNRKTRELIHSHWLYQLIEQPNLEETHSLFFSQLIRDWYAGNVYLYLYKNADGRVVSFFRMDPNMVTVTRDELNRKRYSYNGNVYHADRVLHIPSKYGYDGLKGKSIFSELAEVFETSLKLDQYVNNTFDSNMGKRLVIDATEAYKDLSDEEQKLMRDKFINNYGGIKNAGKPLVKSGGIKFETLDTGTATNQASELSINREYQTKIIAELFHIPPAFLTESLPGEVESLYTVFVNQAIEPLATLFQECFNMLLSPAERESVYFEFSYNSLLKTSLTKRVDAYAKQLTNGMISVDEIRRKENLPELGTSSASTLLVPANLMPVRDDIFDAYMASAKEKLQNLNTTEKTVEKDSSRIGDDKK